MPANKIATNSGLLTGTGAIAYGATPLAGSKLVVTYEHVRAAAAVPISTLAGAGTWTQVDNKTQVNGLSSSKLTRYWRDADGTANDAAPTITFGNTGVVRYTVEEITGLVPGAPDTVGTPVGGTGASGTVTMSGFTPTAAETFIHTAYGYYSTSGVATATPAAPHTVLTALGQSNSGGSFAYTATYQNTLTSPSSQTPAVTYGSGAGTPSAIISSCAWAIASGDYWGVPIS